MDDLYDKEQQKIAESLHEPRETNPIIPDTSNEETSNDEEEEESDDIRNGEEEENDDNRYEDEGESENNMIEEEEEVQETRHSTHIRKPVEWLIEQDDLNTVRKKSDF